MLPPEAYSPTALNCLEDTMRRATAAAAGHKLNEPASDYGKLNLIKLAIETLEEGSEVTTTPILPIVIDVPIKITTPHMPSPPIAYGKYPLENIHKHIMDNIINENIKYN